MSSSILVYFTLVISLLLCYRPIFVTSSVPISSVKPQCHEADMSALLQFKSNFIVIKWASQFPLAYPKTDSWVPGNVHNGTSSNCCLWDGVQCDETSGRVIALDLNSSFLFGSINSSSSLFQLIHLQKINLADNHFNYSQIPAQFGLLRGLTHLSLSASYFYGLIPQEINKLSRLVLLDLCCNVDSYYDYSTSFLSLPRPGLKFLVENLTLLEELSLSYISISSPVPPSLANLSSLRALLMVHTDLYGEFPANVFKLPKLETISLAFNNITGHLPEFSSSTPLRILEIPATRFSGELPASIGNLRFLSRLHLNNANFSGIIPNSLGNLQSLKFLDLSGCKFFGSIPPSFGNLTELAYLSLTTIPFEVQKLDSLSWLWKLTKLTVLGLGDSNLQGEIPSSIGNLSQLVILSLIGNQLKGQIPPQLSNLTRLSELYLRSCNLSSHLPDQLMNMTHLTSLDLCGNQLQGPIPATVAQLQNLELLCLARNNLSGTFELDTLSPLQNLSVLQLSRNKLSIINKSMRNFSLPRLQVLGLGWCNVTEFPSLLHDHQFMNWLDLSNNKLRGEIPIWEWNMGVNYLEFLNLSYNSLTGFTGRPAVLPWNNLVTLDLASNLLEGSLPVSQPLIRSYLVSGNKLTGQFPESFCNYSHLVVLDLSFNSLTGELPQCLGNTSDSLKVLNLQNNGFHGRVPQFHASGVQLKMISLAQNRFHGKLPRSLANCPELQFINLGINEFNDTFPSWLGSLPELRVVILRSNKFHGFIGRPSSPSAFQKLRIMDLSQNSFSGMLPRDYFQSWKDMKDFNTSLGKLLYMNLSLLTANYYLSYTYYGEYDYSMTIVNKGLELFYSKISDIVTAVDFSGNMFEGEIPDNIAELKELHLLNLSGNFLTGQIPASIGTIRALESLDLSRNKLSGKIPEELTKLNFLAVLDVSHNNLTGPIPGGKQFDTFPKTAFEGNDGLCGDALSRRCGGSNANSPGGTRIPGEDQSSSSWYENDWTMVVIGFGGGLVIGAVIGTVLVPDERGWLAAILVRLQEHKRQRRIHRRRHQIRRN